MDISNMLKACRKQNNYTQEYVANQLNISRQAISAWENNNACPDLENLLLLSRLYGTSIDVLLGNDEKNPERGIEHSTEEVSKNIWDHIEKSISRVERILAVFLIVESFHTPILGLILSVFVLINVTKISKYKRCIISACIISIMYGLCVYATTVLQAI